MKKKISIAIDGPAGSGKTTVAREVSRSLGYKYIDTGGDVSRLRMEVARTSDSSG